ncbi:MAG: hypothetical protein IPK58_23715 [Acidobacteria bacterium]|nr:hypothetical protein [Acidobacteriota bacterium]
MSFSNTYTVEVRTKVSNVGDNPRNAGIGQMKIAPVGEHCGTTPIGVAAYQGFVEILNFDRD